MDDLNIHGLGANQASAMDEVDIDNLLGSPLNGSLNGSGEFNQVDTDLLKLMNQNHQLSPTPVETVPAYGHVHLGSPTIDLANLPLTDFTAPIASRELEPDPLLNNQIPQNQQQRNNINDLIVQQQQQQQQEQQRAHLNLNIPEPNPMRGMQQIMANGMPIQQQQMGQNNLQRDLTIEELENERMQLLAKLSEIQHGAAMSSPMNDLMGLQQQQASNEISRQNILLMQLGTMQQQPHQMALMQQRQRQPLRTQPELGESQGSTQQNSTLASAVADMSVKDKSGETPLLTYLRTKGGSGSGGASVFSSTGRASVDPFNKGRGKLSGAMDRSTETHAMIKNFGAQVRTGGKNNSGRNSSFKNGKEQFGGSSVGKGGYIFTGIYSKHASDGNLLRTPGLARSNSKTSLSKDNLLYGLRRGKGRAGSQSKEQLNRLNRKPSASKLDNLRREDSFGAIPVRGKGSSVSKFKFGGSTGNLGSFSNLGSLGGLDSFARLHNAPRGGVDGGAPGRGGTANVKYQGNAQW